MVQISPQLIETINNPSDNTIMLLITTTTKTARDSLVSTLDKAEPIGYTTLRATIPEHDVADVCKTETVTAVDIEKPTRTLS